MPSAQSVSAVTSAVVLASGGNARDIEAAGQISGSVVENNRRLHPNELAILNELLENKNAEEKQRLVEAAMYLVQAEKAVDKSDPHYEQIRAASARGGSYEQEQKQLMQRGIDKSQDTGIFGFFKDQPFSYGIADKGSDLVSRNDEGITRAIGGLKIGAGGAGVVASIAAGTTAMPVTGGLSSLWGATTGTMSVYYAKEGIDQAFGHYEHNEGSKVLESFGAPSRSYLTEKSINIGTDLALAGAGALAIKSIGVASAKVLKAKAGEDAKNLVLIEKPEKWEFSEVREISPGRHLYQPKADMNHPLIKDYVPQEHRKLLEGVGKSTKGYRFAEVNKVPYEPRRIEQLLKQNNPASTVSSSTLPKVNQKNVKLAGKEHSRNSIPFDVRGLPIFDKHVVFDTKIPLTVSQTKNAESHMRAATRDLREKIQQGVIDKSKFTLEQLENIQAGKERIPGFTWHHHQDQGRMQLIPKEVHNETGHVGGMDLWYEK